MHEISNPVLGKNKENISKCHVLKFLPRVLSVKDNSYFFRGDKSLKTHFNCIASPFWEQVLSLYARLKNGTYHVTGYDVRPSINFFVSG